jgi:hypothetical protein
MYRNLRNTKHYLSEMSHDIKRKDNSRKGKYC